MYKILIVLVLIFSGQHAYTQETKESREHYCAPTKALVEALAVRFDEQMIAWGSGQSGSGTVMSLWVNAASGSWSILVSRQDGTSCVLGTGQEFSVQRLGSKV